jgi:hypothetical protein
MAIVPLTKLGKCIAAIWFGLCIAVLVFGYEQRHIHDMPVAFILFMLFLSVPAGILVSSLYALSVPFLSGLPGYVFNPFLAVLPFWIGCVLLGYLQWFVIIPGLWRRIFRAKAIEHAADPGHLR